jgi:hypothetical protein
VALTLRDVRMNRLCLTCQHSYEMAYFRYTVPIDGAVAAMLRKTVPVYRFKHGVWMGLLTNVGDTRRIEYAW